MSGSNKQNVPANGTTIGSGTLGGERVADVLLMFLSNPGTLGVSDIARSLGLSKAVVHRILQSLVSRGLVEANAADQRYRIGRAIAELGLPASYEYDHVWHAAGASILRELRDRTGETATLSVRVGTMRIFVDQMEGAAMIRLTVALWRPRPLHSGASGKAILAFLEPDLRQKIIDYRLPAEGGASAPPRKDLESELERIRSARVALSRAEVNPDAIAIAAPVFRAGQPVGAVGVLGSVRHESEFAGFVPLVRAAGEQLSGSLSR